MTAASFAAASSILATTDGAWQSNAQPWDCINWPSPSCTVPTNNPYWANPSGDGYQHGVGYYLENTNSWPSVTYYGNSDGTAVPDLDFNGGGVSYSLTLASVNTLATGDVVGYYDQDGYHPLFTASDPEGDVQVFTPVGAVWSLYECPAADVGSGNACSDYWNSQTADSSTGAGTEATDLGTYHQHFAIFADPNAPDPADLSSYYIGVEDGITDSEITAARDLPVPGEMTGDYNDLVFTYSSVPEPTTMVLVGSALFGLAWIRRRRATR
jgi:PEP-CTERM motif